MTPRELAKKELLPKLAEIFCYDPESGLITWRDLRRAGQAGNYNAKKNRWRIGCPGGCAFMASHIAWAIHYGEWPTMEIDHINGNASDNSIRNLRDIPGEKNLKNRGKTRDNKSGFKGVFPCRRGHYTAEIKSDGRKHYLGEFVDPVEAARAYNRAALKYHGEFARLNEIPGEQHGH